MKNEKYGSLKNLNPKEIDVIKGQIAAMLNYTTQGGSAARIDNSILEKIDPNARLDLTKRIENLLDIGGSLKELSPKEVNVVKGQIAAMLNYTTQGGSPATIDAAILQKIPQENRKEIRTKIEKLLDI